MTCIIATRRFVCADRRVTEDGAATSLVKLAKNPWLIAAAAGSATANIAVKRAVREGAQSPAELLPCLDVGSYALVLTWDGVLTLLSEGIAWPAPGKVSAIGSGADLALGFMYGAESFSVATARQAQKFVAARRADCGGGCDVRSFE